MSPQFFIPVSFSFYFMFFYFFLLFLDDDDTLTYGPADTNAILHIHARTPLVGYG